MYGNMVDFSFIVSLYVSDLRNVTIKYEQMRWRYEQEVVRAVVRVPALAAVL